MKTAFSGRALINYLELIEADVSSIKADLKQHLKHLLPELLICFKQALTSLLDTGKMLGIRKQTFTPTFPEIYFALISHEFSFEILLTKLKLSE